MRGNRQEQPLKLCLNASNIPKESRGQLCQSGADKWSIVSAEVMALSASIQRALLILSKSLLILRKMYCDWV